MCDYPWGPKFERDEDTVNFECAMCNKEFEVELHEERSFTSRYRDEDKSKEK
jgi:hypothetical protein